MRCGWRRCAELPGLLTAPWIERAPGAPYFRTDHGQTWTPIGGNESIAWFEFRGLVGRWDLDQVRAHLRWLAANGVTCLRLMMEDAETGAFFLEQPAGVFNPVVVQMWDDLFALMREAGLRALLTPLDTFFHFVRWDIHPYNQANGGPCEAPTSLMCCPGVRGLIKGRLEFATRRWGADGTIFAWDLWNEMHPVQGEDRPGIFEDYIGDVGPWLRALEEEVHGRAHLQTVSIFGPELRWKPWLNAPLFRARELDFSNSHMYEEGSIDHPLDSVAPALSVVGLVREALAEIEDGRPFFDTEHGPIHTFKDLRITLPEAFDDEYFRHMQWAHLAAGGAGGGMRWPNRHPHALTPGMRAAQGALARFLPLIDWQRFDRKPIEAGCDDRGVVVVGCASADQAVLFLLRRAVAEDGRVEPALRPGPGLALPVSGRVRWADAITGEMVSEGRVEAGRVVAPPFGAALLGAVGPP